MVGRRSRRKEAVFDAEGLALEDQLHASNPLRRFRYRSNTSAGWERKEPTTKAPVFVIFSGCRSSFRCFLSPFPLVASGSCSKAFLAVPAPRISGKILKVPGKSTYPH
jgi:hypothetical protein